MWLWLLSSGAGEALLRAAAATDVWQSGAPWPGARAAAAERRCWRTGAGCCAGGDIGAGLREVCVCGAGRGVPYAGPWGGRERLTHLPGVGAGGSRQPRRRLSTPLPAAAPPPPARCGRSSACCPRLCGAACLCLGDAGLRALSPQNTEVVAQAKPDRFPRLYVLPHMPSFSIRKFMVQGEPKALSYLVESSGCLAG